MADTIVIYYSLDGNCEMVAGHAARFAEADLVRIKTFKEIPKKGLMKMIRGGAGVVFGKKPKIVPEHVDLSGYENVILCYPIWAGSFPPAMNTFLSENKLHAPLYVITSSASGDGLKSVDAVENVTGIKVSDSLHLKNPLKDRNRSRKFTESFITKNGI